MIVSSFIEVTLRPLETYRVEFMRPNKVLRDSLIYWGTYTDAFVG
jgi:hypothetical protein